MSGVGTNELEARAFVDELIANAGGTTVRITVANLLRLMPGEVSGPVYQTYAELAADLAWVESAVALVWGDDDEQLRGLYRKTGDAGSGTWTRYADSPISAVAMAAAYASAQAAAGSADTASTKAAEVVSLHDEAGQYARGNYAGKSTFEDEDPGLWDKGVADVPAAHPLGRTKALWANERNTYYLPVSDGAYQEDVNGRTFEISGWLYNASTVDVRVGIRITGTTGSFSWINTFAGSANGNAWVYVSTRITFNQTSKSWVPFLQVNGWAPGDTLSAFWTDIEFRDVTDLAAAAAASASQQTATTKAGEAAASAQSASDDAATATTKANEAAASALTASDAAATATSKANVATNAQAAAEAARDQTLAAFDNFDDRYLGAFASEPTTDNDGNPLVSGTLFYDETAGGMKVYTGSTWAAAYISSAGVLLAAENLSDLTDPAAARGHLGLKTAATYDVTDDPDLGVNGGQLPIRSNVAAAIAAAFNGKLYDFQEFTASGTWTKPATALSTDVVVVQIVGGGGSGGRNNNAGGSGGGGGGGIIAKFETIDDFGATETVVVGAGGAAVTSNTNGNGGGNSTFGTSGNPIFLRATGGARGLQGGTGVSGGAGGIAYFGNLEPSFALSAGGNGGNFKSNASPFPGGNAIYGAGGGGGSYPKGDNEASGGPSQFAGNGGWGRRWSAGEDGKFPGGGGGGARDVARSGAGAPGVVRVWCYRKET